MIFVNLVVTSYFWTTKFEYTVFK